MDSNNKNKLLNLDIDFDETITLDNLKNFDLDAHFDSDLNLNFDLDFENTDDNSKVNINKNSNNKNDCEINKKIRNKKLKNKKEDETINDNQFENLLSGFKDKYDINNKKISETAIQKNKEEAKSCLLINSVINEHKEDINNAIQIDAQQYNILLKNIQIDNKQNIKEKQINKFQKILGICESNNLDNDNLHNNYIDNNISETGNNGSNRKEKYNTKFLNILIDFYLDFENCDLRNNPQLFFLVSKLNDYRLVVDTLELKNGDVIKYPVVKYNNENEDYIEVDSEEKLKEYKDKTENTAIPELMTVFFIKKFSNKLKVSKHNNCWFIWDDIPLFKKINN